MKLILSPTDKIENIEGVRWRMWTGETEFGFPIHAYIRCLSPQTRDADVRALFDRKLKSLPPARREAVSYDIRFLVD
jgi:hypothetical protein